MGWFDRRPLFGRTIVVTRAREQASQLRTLLEVAGATVIEAPAIRIEPLDKTALRHALDEIAMLRMDRRSRAATPSRSCGRELRERGLDARAFAANTIIAVGPGTADALLAHGIAVDVMPDRYVAEGIIEKLRERDDVRGRARALPARGGRARSAPGCAARDGRRTSTKSRSIARFPISPVSSALGDALDAGTVDLVTFTSASTVRHFVDALGAERARTVRGASMGPITSEAARELGVPIEIEARESTIASFVESIISHLAVPARPAR